MSSPRPPATACYPGPTRRSTPAASAHWPPAVLPPRCSGQARTDKPGKPLSPAACTPSHRVVTSSCGRPPAPVAAAPPAMPRTSTRRQASHKARRRCPAGAAAKQAPSRLLHSARVDHQREPLLRECFRLGQVHRANASRTATPRQSAQLKPGRSHCRSLPASPYSARARSALLRLVLASATPRPGRPLLSLS
jgi:hypothetical protein